MVQYLVLITNFCMASVLKQEYAPDAPAIYGIRIVLESDNLKTWIDMTHIDKFILILLQTWEGILKVDPTEKYDFMDYLNPNRII